MIDQAYADREQRDYEEVLHKFDEMLTRQAALMIALPATASLIEQLSELQRQYCAKADAQDLRGIHEANDAFHVALFSACGNPYLVRSLQDYMNLTLPMRAKNLADREGLAQSRRQLGQRLRCRAGAEGHDRRIALRTVGPQGDRAGLHPEE